MAIDSHLLSLGFTSNDAAVYLALLKHGPCTAGPLITETGFHRNIIYTSLEHLAARKLISEKIIRGRTNFTATDPHRLVDEFTEKATLAHQVAKDLRTRLSVDPQEITVHQGNQEYLTLLTSIINALPKGSTKYVLGTGGEAFMCQTMIPLWEDYHAIASKQKIRIHMIGYEPQREAIDPWTRPTRLYDIRYLPAQLENPSGIHIYPEVTTVLNIIYSDDHQPVTAIKIKNASLAKGYLNLFENLWKMGKK